MTGIVTVTLNPALDLTTSVESLVSGIKLRCRTPRVDAGGGGVNVSRAIAKLGDTSLALVALGGPTGETLRRILETEGIRHECFETDGETRQSLVVHEDATGEQYRFILPGPCWSESMFEALVDRLKRLIEQGSCVVVSGSMPPGVGENAAVRIVELAESMNAHVVADISGPALTTLTQSTSNRSLTLIMSESVATGIAGKHLDVGQAAEFCLRLVDNDAAETAIVTLGDMGVVAAREGKAWHLVPPPVDVVSKVGAGDSFAAGLVIGLCKTWPFAEALTYAMAAASSAVTTPATELCTREGTAACIDSVSCNLL